MSKQSGIYFTSPLTLVGGGLRKKKKEMELLGQVVPNLQYCSEGQVTRSILCETILCERIEYEC